MISQKQIDQEIRALPAGQLRNLDTAKVARQLSYWEDHYGLKLSFYGLLKWAIERYGGKALFDNVLASDATAKGYADAALHYRDDMPSAIVNAGQYLNALSSQVGDVEICIKQLERMSFPYIIYVLFAGAGQESLVQEYKDAVHEHMKRYPSTLDKLPERYRTIPELHKGEQENADAR